MQEIPLRCRCGAVRGVVTSLRPSNRVVCHCDDCQAYAKHLGGEGVVDRHGGTDIVQVPPSHVRIDAGHRELRSLRLSERGLLRFYAGCCDTPIANMLATRRSPFVGVVAACVDVPEHDRDARLGPVRASTYGRYAIPPVPAHVHPTAPPGFLARAVAFLLRNAVLRTWRGSPFFDPRTGAPVAPARVLTPAERDALR